MEMNNVKKVVAYTKGSGKDSEDSCGWSYVLKCATSGEDEKKDSFRMEMHAVLNALRAVSDLKDTGVPVEIRSNNEVIVKLCKREYKVSENEDLWEEIFKEIDKSPTKNLKFEYVPASERDSNFDEARKMARDKSVE